MNRRTTHHDLSITQSRLSQALVVPLRTTRNLTSTTTSSQSQVKPLFVDGLRQVGQAAAAAVAAHTISELRRGMTLGKRRRI